MCGLAGIFDTLHFRGTPNNWGTTAMERVGNSDGYQTCQSFRDVPNPRFKIDHFGDWSENYPANDIAVADGSYRITFNATDKAISTVVAEGGVLACRELGVSTVAVHSTADDGSLHVTYADEDVCIGPPPSTDSYLNLSSVIAAAEITGAEAVHPGYGFLAENAHFAEVLAECRLAWIGPRPETIRVGLRHQLRSEPAGRCRKRAGRRPRIDRSRWTQRPASARREKHRTAHRLRGATAAFELRPVRWRAPQRSPD